MQSAVMHRAARSARDEEIAAGGEAALTQALLPKTASAVSEPPARRRLSGPPSGTTRNANCAA